MPKIRAEIPLLVICFCILHVKGADTEIGKQNFEESFVPPNTLIYFYSDNKSCEIVRTLLFYCKTLRFRVAMKKMRKKISVVLSWRSLQSTNKVKGVES